MALLVRGEILAIAEHAPKAAPRVQTIRDGAVLVEGERIAAVGAYDALRAQYPGADEMGSPRHLVLPGFVNAHDHARGLGHFQGGVPEVPAERGRVVG